VYLRFGEGYGKKKINLEAENEGVLKGKRRRREGKV